MLEEEHQDQDSKTSQSTESLQPIENPQPIESLQPEEDSESPTTESSANHSSQGSDEDEGEYFIEEVSPPSEEGSSEDVESGLLDDRYKWYIVSTYAGSEDSAKLNLWDRVRRAAQEDYFRDVVIPKITVDKLLKGGERKKVEKTSFPGYMFVQMDLSDDTMATVVGTSRVMGFLGNYKNPKPMSDQDVLRFLGAPSEDDVKEEPEKEIMFEKDQAIRVIDGPFANFDGIVEEVKADKMKLKVLVSILGRETPVELSYNQVEKVDV